MKKILLSFLMLFALVAANNAKAQCDLKFSNLIVAAVGDPISIGANKCQVTFNASFDIITNSGFKHLYFHSWLLQDYPNPPIFDCTGDHTPATDPGTSEQLGTAIDDPGKSFLDIGFEGLFDITFNPDVAVNVTSNISTVYPHDPSVVLIMPSNSPGMNAVITRKGTSDTLHFDVTNIKIIANVPCGSDVFVITDIWGSNSNAPDPKAQCYICGFGQTSGEPQIALQKLCNQVPFQYSIRLTTSVQTDLHVVFRIYADDLDGIPEPGGDDSLLFTSGVITINSSTQFNSGLVTLPGDFCCSPPWSQWGIFAIVTGAEFANEIRTPVIEEACALNPLPVSLRSFTASRNSSTVNLNWETVTEENSKGFNIQRNLGNGWEQIGFVETKAINGNSSSLLSYAFSDLNNHAKGLSQYRLQQVDIGGKFAYSQIRSVRATAQKGKTIIYPNPSNDGKVNVVFEDKDVSRNVSLTDMNGRIIKQWKNILSNTLQIENLISGFYTLRIVNSETGEQIVEKIVVKNR